MNPFFYPFHINDWRRDTVHLSLLERGVYRELLDHFYFTNGKLTKEKSQLYRAVGAQNGPERKAVDRIVGLFFHAEGEYLFQKRAVKELESIREKSRKAREAIAIRWRRKNNDLDDTDVHSDEIDLNPNGNTIQESGINNHESIIINHQQTSHESSANNQHPKLTKVDDEKKWGSL